MIAFYFSLANDDFSVFHVKRYFIFSQNLFYNHPHFFPEAWSLSVEEWFYLLIPISIFMLISFVKMTPRNAVLFSAGFLLVAITLFRIYRYSQVEIDSFYWWDLIFRKQVITRLDSLMFGVFGAYIQYYHSAEWAKFKSPSLIFGILIFLITKVLYTNELIAAGGFYNCVFSFSVTSLATLLLLPYLSSVKSGKGVFYKAITIISLISYSMYLLNFTIVEKIIIESLIPWSALSKNPYVIILSQYTTYWFLTVVGSMLIYKYYELPLTALRDKKWLKKRLEIVHDRP